MTDTYKRGDTVTILNQDYWGLPIVEGDAKLLKELDSLFDDIPRWTVQFPDGDIVDRNIYPPDQVQSVREMEARRKENEA